MKIISRLSWLFVGGLFIFSGLIKINDPVGTAIKLEEYFDVFAADFSSFFLNFKPFALYLSIFLSGLEIILGVALLLRWRLRQILPGLLALIIFFTFLTFYSAYFNKVTDCGCFGDAIKLTPWQSFSKDILLLVLILILLGTRRYLPETKSITMA
ncbi:MAG: DoxX family protein, partial [Bacteroidota bacterium]|nr:DoxX family protein [Bacteroidota bacterium]